MCITQAGKAGWWHCIQKVESLKHFFCSDLVSPFPRCASPLRERQTMLRRRGAYAAALKQYKCEPGCQWQSRDCQQCGAWPELKLADATKPAAATKRYETRGQEKCYSNRLQQSECSFAFGHKAPLVSTFWGSLVSNKHPQFENKQTYNVSLCPPKIIKRGFGSK